jgi:hypothetical protein
MSAATGSLLIALCWIVPFAFGGHVRLGDARVSRRLLSRRPSSASCCQCARTRCRPVETVPFVGAALGDALLLLMAN